MCKEESRPLLGSGKNVSKYVVGLENKEQKEKEEIQESQVAPTQTMEDWRCWLIVAAAFFAMFVLNGAEYSFGCLMEPLMEETGLARSTISIAGSTQVALSAFTAPLASAMINKMGTRRVSTIGCVMAAVGLIGASFATEIVGILTGLSILAGSGFGLMYMPAMVAVAENFSTRRALAMGLALCGPGAGQIVLSPIMNYLTQEYGWRGCLRALSGLCLLCVITGRVLKQPSSTPTTSSSDSLTEINEDDINSFDKKRRYLAYILGDQLSYHKYVWVFLLIVLADSFAVLALFIPYQYIHPVAASNDIPKHLTSLLISCIGLGSVAGRVTSSLISVQSWCKPLHLIRAGISLVSILPFAITFVDKFWMLAGLCALFGFLTGIWIAATSPFLAKLLGVTNINQALGLLTFAQGAASLVSPPLAGLAVEHTNDPLVAFYLCGALLMVSATIYTAAIMLYNKKNRIIVYDRFYSEI